MSLKIDKKWLRQFIDKNYQFDFDSGCFRRKRPYGRVKIGDRCGFIMKSGYSMLSFRGIDIFEHNVVWFYFKGKFPPKGVEIDHKDRNRSYNHPDNFRLGTRSQNNANMKLRSDNKVGYRGVHFNKAKQKYCAQVTKDGKIKSLGYFDTAEEAAKKVAIIRDNIFGEFAFHPNMWSLLPSGLDKRK